MKLLLLLFLFSEIDENCYIITNIPMILLIILMPKFFKACYFLEENVYNQLKFQATLMYLRYKYFLVFSLRNKERDFYNYDFSRPKLQSMIKE